MKNIELVIRSDKGVLKVTLLNDFALKIFNDLIKANNVRKERKYFKDGAKDVYVLTEAVSITTRIMEISLFEGFYVELT